MKVKLVSTVAFSILAFAVFLSSCNKIKSKGVEHDTPDMPAKAPNYSKSSNDELAYLGRVIFYDKKLSSDNTISCASCHKQQYGFADNGASSEGVYGQLTKRNAPQIFPKNGRMFWDGRAKNLNDMVTMPIENEVEMNIHNFDELCAKLSNTGYYPKLFKKAYHDEAVTKEKIRTALAEFVRNFDFSNNKFKSGNASASKSFSNEEKNGKDLFFGKAKCSECHHLDNNFSNGYGKTDESHNIGLDFESSDKGCGETNKNTKEYGEFMMPVLLNIELTAPYMHDGRLATLEDVVEHYNSKVKLSPNLDWRLKDFKEFKNIQDARMKLDKNSDGKIDEIEAPGREAQNLNLSNTEKANLVQFLKTLTDKNLAKDTKFSSPFVY